MEAIIQKWGNDFGIRIPISVARKMSLKTGYKVIIVPMEQISIKPIPRKGWAKAFAKIEKKEKLLISERINNSNFEWDW